MRRVFIEAKDFKKRVDELGGEELLQAIQNEILKDPEKGSIIRETGGIRKLRLTLEGKGKSGGLRVFYLDSAEREKCYLLFILKKSESENVSAEGKRMLKVLARKLKK